jgi:hypothetical protein
VKVERYGPLLPPVRRLSWFDQSMNIAKFLLCYNIVFCVFNFLLGEVIGPVAVAQHQAKHGLALLLLSSRD